MYLYTCSNNVYSLVLALEVPLGYNVDPLMADPSLSLLATQFGTNAFSEQKRTQHLLTVLGVLLQCYYTVLIQCLMATCDIHVSHYYKVYP